MMIKANKNIGMLLLLCTTSVCLLVVSGKYPTKQVVLWQPEAILADQKQS